MRCRSRFRLSSARARPSSSSTTTPPSGDDTNAIQDGVGNDTPDFTTGSGGVPAVTNDSTAANAVLAGWSLTPTGLAVGAQFRLLFLSSTKRDATATDIATYNTFVQTRAAAGHADIRAYSAGFRVVGCTAATDARDNTSTTFTTEDKGVPIYWLNGAKAADEYEDFYDGDWDDEANDKNESGSDGFDTSQISNFPLTGCTHEGTEKFTVINLSQALGSTEFNPAIGRPNSSSGGNGPLSSTSSASPLARPMYGLSAVFQVADAPDTTPPTLTSADVEEANGLTIYLEFSEDLQLSNPPLASAFTLTVDGSAVTGFSVAVPGSLLPQNAIWLHPPTAIRQGQAVVVTYTDPTADNDTAAIQDTAGNDTPDFTTGMNSVPAVTNNSTVATAVLNNWSLKPTGLNTGDQFRLLFLSSTSRNASATASADYNTFVQTRAAAGHTDIRDYSAGFRVVGCTADTDARDNTSTTYISTAKGVPIYWLDGTKAADEYEDFYDGDWDDEANDKNESGTDGPDTSQQANYPWTGCNHDGTEATGFGGVSRGLGSTTGNLVRFGRPNSSNANHGPLSGAQNFSKTQTRPLYGLSAVFQVAAAVVINNPPAFSGSTAARSVAENTAAGQNVGAALTATDLDGHTLIYTLEGTDAASFGILSASGQIQTKTGVTYNHEAQSTYTVIVKADDSNGGTDTVTVTITVTDVNEPPGVPAAPSVTATSGSTTSLDVSWTAPTNTGPAITSYDLQYREGTSGSFTAGPQDVTGTSAAIASLTASTSHQVQVRATNAEGDGDWSFAGTGRTGNNAPVFSSSTAARSVAENTAAGQNVGAVLTATDLDSDTLIYTLEGTDAASFGILSASGQIQTKAGVTYNHEAQSTYTVIVKADDSNGGTDTVTVTITVTDVNEPPGVPAAPSVTATSGSSTSLDVSWTAPTNTGPAITSYDLQYREGTSGSFTAGPQDVTGTSAAIASLTASTSHQVQVRATNAEGDSDWSPSGPGRTGNNAPVFSSSTAARSVAENTAAGQNVGAVLTATDLDSDTLIYTLEGADAASFGILSASGQIQTKAGVTYNHEAKSTYTVIVKADDSNGGTATVTVTITVTDVNEPPGVPAAPSVSGTTGSTTSLDVSWTAPTNTGPAIASYDLQYREGTSGAFTDGPQNVTGTSAAIASLMPGTSHQVQVRATNAEGDSDWSPSGPGRTGTSVPGAPTGLMATANGNTQIDLSWTAPASNGGSAITGYRIEESPNGNSNWTTLEANTNGPGTTYAHTGLAAGTTRHYRVSAINTNGAGAASNVDGATTGTTVPGAPTSLVATASGNTRINLSWTAPASTGGSPITGYKIEVSSDGGTSVVRPRSQHQQPRAPPTPTPAWPPAPPATTASRPSTPTAPAPPPASTTPPPAPPCPAPPPASRQQPAGPPRSTSPGPPPPTPAAAPSPATGSRSPPMATPAGPPSKPTPTAPTPPTRAPASPAAPPATTASRPSTPTASARPPTSTTPPPAPACPTPPPA